MRRLRRTEAGMTLIEVMIAMMIMVMVGPIITSVMVSTLRAGKSTEDQSRVVDELRQQMYAVSRELRSASCIGAPAVANTPGNTLTFTTESQTGSVTTTQYLQYQVVNQSDGTYLIRRVLDVYGAVQSSRYVGPGLVSPNTTFELRSTPRKSIIVKLQLQLEATRPVQELSTTIAGRNAWLVCA
jgi:prepilin-type N-terminal cleavage/methylation domain-containing protein